MAIITIQSAIDQLDDYKREFERQPWAVLHPDISWHLCCIIEELEGME